MFTGGRVNQKNLTGRLLYPEIRVGRNTPGIIKYNFWQRVYENENAVYACVNLNEAYTADEIADRSLCITGDITEVIEKLPG